MIKMKLLTSLYFPLWQLLQFSETNHSYVKRLTAWLYSPDSKRKLANPVSAMKEGSFWNFLFLFLQMEARTSDAFSEHASRGSVYVWKYTVGHPLTVLFPS